MKKQIWKRLPIILFILISGGCYSCGQKQNTEAILPAQESELFLLTESVSQIAEEALPVEETKAAVCYVYVCGAVHHAGVYEVPDGERIYRVLELAGGYTEEAAKEYLNLALPVADGMKLFVPTQAELETLNATGFFPQVFEPSGQSPTAGSSIIDLNKASKEELMTLTGIGEAKAEAIIKYRQETGRFHRIEDIMNISGIKQTAFDKIKDKITVTN